MGRLKIQERVIIVKTYYKSLDYELVVIRNVRTLQGIVKENKDIPQCFHQRCLS